MASLYENAVQNIIEAGARLNLQNLAPATSGNYSVRIGADEMAITVSGVHKGHLEPEHIMRVDFDGTSLDSKKDTKKDGKKPSDETLLHCLIYKIYPDIGAVLHTHSVACTALTKIMSNDDALILSGYEMLKAYRHIDTHDTVVSLPIFENTQDITELSARVNKYLSQYPKTPAYLIRGHGIYGWGADIGEAMRVIEATEMLLLVEMQLKGIGK